jgi:hypothetical protein
MKLMHFWVAGAEIRKKRSLRVNEVKIGAILLQKINFLLEK